jgi:hypothetical protein
MPVCFRCTLVCDAEGCDNAQPASAELRSGAPLESLVGLLQGEAFLFDVSYDRSTGLEWVMGSGKAACSPACQAKVAAQKEKQAPGGKGRPLSVVGGDDED